MQRDASPTIIAVDLLRFACAALVVAYHVNVAYWLSPSTHGAVILPSHLNDAAGNAVTRVGWIGIELFFVISGLVIAQSAIDARWTDFLRRRALRLAPAAWLCASATAALLLSTGQFGADIMMSWVRSVLFWPIGAPIDMSYWTLGVESFFYLLVAAVIGSRGTRERIERIGIALGILSGGTWLLTLGWPGWTGGIVANQAATLLQVPFGVFFAIGIFITTSRGRRLGLAHAGYAAFLVIAAIIEIDRHAAGRAAAMGVPTSSAVAIGIFLAGLAIIIAAPVLQRPLSRWLSPATARTIGLMTYPLYLIHQDAGAVVMARLLAAGMPMPIAQAITAATMVGAAWAIARWPEPWLRDRLAIAFNRRRGRAPDNRPTAFPSAG